MKAINLLNDLRATSNYHPESTVDKIIIGDPNKEVRRVLTTWISSMRVVQAAIDGGYDALITHEPTFYQHRDELENVAALDDDSFLKYAALQKKKLIDESGLVVFRVHDSWDKRPGCGMADTWAKLLGFANPVKVSDDGFQMRFDIEPITLDDLAKKVARATATLGEPLVQVIGDGTKKVSKVCLGPGYASTVQVGRQLGCEVNISCDDGSTFWLDIQAAVDIGHSIIRVNHGTTEEAGTATIATYINEHYPDVHAEHLPHRPYYRMIGAE